MNNNVQNSNNSASVVALVCGIISIVGGWISYFNIISLILGIIGIIFGIKGRKESPVGKTGMATAGFVCSIIGTVFSAMGFLMCTVCICFYTAAFM